MLAGFCYIMYNVMYNPDGHQEGKVAMKVRKQIYIEPEQDQLLKSVSRDTGLSEAELIRQAIDSHVEELHRRKLGLAAWGKERAFILNRMKLGPVPGKRNWR